MAAAEQVPASGRDPVHELLTISSIVIRAPALHLQHLLEPRSPEDRRLEMMEVSRGYDASERRALMSGLEASRNRRNNAIYGYHNTFHLHASPTLPPAHSPPRYSCLSQPIQRSNAAADVLPAYTCTIQLRAQLGLRREIASHFVIAAPVDSEWQDVFVALQGTQLRVHRLKVAGHTTMLGKIREPVAGKLIQAYSLQHAEVGLATDIGRSELVPRRGFNRLIPPNTREKLFETDPHLFEPVREHILRIRIEAEQFLLCAKTQEQLLDWVEALTVAIDISMPLEDRSEPRYRSLPRRARRQRELEGRSGVETLHEIESRPRLVAQQERIIREMYPHLAGDEETANTEHAQEAEETFAPLQEQSTNDVRGRPFNSDQDDEELDREDAMVLGSSQPPTPSANHSTNDPGQGTSSYFDVRTSVLERSAQTEGNHTAALASSLSSSMNHAEELTAIASLLWEFPGLQTESIDERDAKPVYTATPQLRPGAALRYRRRCAPILLASSPRTSDIAIVSAFPPPSKKKHHDRQRGAGVPMQRLRLDFKHRVAVPFEVLPPRYEAHAFDKPRRRQSWEDLAELLSDESEAAEYAGVSTDRDSQSQSLEGVDDLAMDISIADLSGSLESAAVSDEASAGPLISSTPPSLYHSTNSSEDNVSQAVASTQRDSDSSGSSVVGDDGSLHQRQTSLSLVKTWTADSRLSVQDVKTRMKDRRRAYQSKLGPLSPRKTDLKDASVSPVAADIASTDVFGVSYPVLLF